ncbi:hypothetical protein U1Q18_010456 [Sarracenia purpurea var. burkii]
MEDSKSNTNNNDDDDDHFLDALDEFPFYDCADTDEQEQSTSNSSSISFLEANADVSLKSKPSLEILSPTGLRRRRSLSQHIRKDTGGNDSENSDARSSVSIDTTTPALKKYRISRNLKEIEKGNEKSDSFLVRLGSERSNPSENGEIKENSIEVTADDDKVNDVVMVDSVSGGTDDSSSRILFVLAGLVIKAIGFQMRLLVSFFTFPIWLLYVSYIFVIDPFQAVRRGREYLMGSFLRIWGVICDNVTPLIPGRFKEHQSIWKLALRFALGLLWASYVCFVLVSLFVSAFVVSGFVMGYLVEEPIQMKETITLDYTKNSPVAFVPIISCPVEHHGVISREKNEIVNLGMPRVIPAKHKLQVTVSLTLPESDYNRNLGIFQVCLDHRLIRLKFV